MNRGDSLSDRMKGYENISRIYLTRRTPVIIRIDGRCFHTFTEGFRRPFDTILMSTMQQTAKYLCENICGCKLAYTQSDEISLLLTNYDTIDTQPWFDNNLQKLVSISASMATMIFNRIFLEEVRKFEDSIHWDATEEEAKYSIALHRALEKGAMFDARAFTIPKEEVTNYFIGRQQDASKNSIQMLARANLSHKELQEKNTVAIQDMLYGKEVNWNDCKITCKRGTAVIKRTLSMEDGGYRTEWIVDENIPVFTQDRNYIEGLVYNENISNIG